MFGRLKARILGRGRPPRTGAGTGRSGRRTARAVRPVIAAGVNADHAKTEKPSAGRTQLKQDTKPPAARTPLRIAGPRAARRPVTPDDVVRTIRGPENSKKVGQVRTAKHAPRRRKQ